MHEEPGFKNGGYFCCRSLLGISLQILLWRATTQVLSHPWCPGTLAMQPAPRRPGEPRPAGRAGVLPAPASSPGKKGAQGRLQGSLLGIATTFLTPNQPGSLAGHLGTSSRAAKACDSPRSRGWVWLLAPVASSALGG